MPLITGSVIDANGRPVADARIAFSRAPVAMPDIAMLTDERGTFTISVPVKGTYELTFTADPHPPRAEMVNVDADRVHVELRVPLPNSRQ
jgi:hypothetical protein